MNKFIIKLFLILLMRF